MSQRLKIGLYGLAVFLTVWMGGCLLKHQQPVYAKWRLKRQLQRVEPWTATTNYSATGWEQLVKTARAIQNTNPRLAEEALNEHLQRYAASPDQLSSEQAKTFLLLRMVFDLPQSVPAGQYMIFANWKRGRSDVNPDASVNLGWPLVWNEGKPRLVAGCEGSAGNGYSAGNEFAYMRYKFRPRDLGRVSWKP